MPRTTGRFSGVNRQGVGAGSSSLMKRAGAAGLYKRPDGSTTLRDVVSDAVFDTRPSFGTGATLLSDSFSYPAGSLRGQGDWSATDSLWGSGTLNVSAGGQVNAVTDNVYGDVISNTSSYGEGDYILTWGVGAGFGRGSYLNILSTVGASATAAIGMEPGNTTIDVYTYTGGSLSYSALIPVAINSGDRVGIRRDGGRLFYFIQFGATGPWVPIGSAAWEGASTGRIGMEAESDSQNLDDLLVTALVAGGSGPVALLPALESDVAVAFGRVKRRALGTALESDAGLVFGRRKQRAVGVAAEADAALLFGRVKRRAVGVAVETDVAVLLGRRKQRAVGIAVETDSGLLLGRVKVRAVGVAAESDAGLAFGRVKVRVLGIGLETDEAVAITAGAFSQPMAPALETDTALAFGRVKRRALGTAVETDAGQALGRVKRRAVVVAVEVDAGLVLGRVKRRAVGIALETDAGQALGRRKLRAVGVALEADAGQAFGRRKRRALGVAGESGVAVLLGRVHRYTLGTALETEGAFPFGRLRRRGLGVAVEVDQALTLVPVTPQVLALRTALEVDVALPIRRRGRGTSGGDLAGVGRGSSGAVSGGGRETAGSVSGGGRGVLAGSVTGGSR